MRYLLLILVSLISLESWCQVRELRFRTLSVENGLPENFPTTSLQDKYGYIWFGTQNGLVRYDGYNVKVYNLETEDKKEKIYRSIRKIFEDSKGRLWIGTIMQGLFLYNRSTDNFKEFVHQQKGSVPKKDDVAHIAEDEKGHIWTLNWSGREKGYHVDKLNSATGAIISIDSFSKGNNYIPSKTLNYLYADSRKRIWVGSANGLFLFDAQKQRFVPYFSTGDSTKRTTINSIYEAPSQPGILWLSQFNKEGAALVAFNTSTGQVKNYRNNPGDATSIAADSVLTIYEDRSKNLWIGTTKGLSLLNRTTGKFTNYRSDDNATEIGANYLNDIKEGRNGELWILSGKGLMHLSSPGGKLTRHIADAFVPDGLPVNILSTSLIDRNGVLWVGARGHGLLRLNEQRSQFKFITTAVGKDSYPGGALLGLDRMKNGKYLLTTPKGLFEADSLFSSFKEIPVTADKNINMTLRSVKVDEQGLVWIGSANNGLFKYDPKTKRVTRFLNNNKDSTSVSNDNIRALYIDRKQNFWVGTYGGGLCKLDRKTGTFKRYAYIINEGDTPPNGALDDDQVTSILEDNKGQLWIGTNNGGLNKLDQETGRFTSYYSKDKGLTCVVEMFEDSKSRLWLGTYLWGLFLFDRQTGTSKRFTEKEGLLYDNVYVIKEDGKGKIWLGSGRGFSILNTADFSIKTMTARTGLPSPISNNFKYATPEGDWLLATTKGILRFNPDNLIINKTPPEIILQSISYNKKGLTDSLPETILIHDQKKIEFAYNENRISFQYAGIHFTNPSLNQYKYKLEGYDKDWIDGKNQRAVTYTNLSPGTYTFHVKAASSDGVWSEKDASIDLLIHPPWWKTWWAYLLYILAFAFAIWAYLGYRSKALRHENRILEEKVTHRTVQLQQSIENLKTTQQQLVQSEKMASLGELTAGIAHEIQNPLNFVNNFSEVNKELLAEMNAEIEKGNYDEVKEIAKDVSENEEKINHHGNVLMPL